MANQHTFDRTTLKANGGPADGDYYGMPWPCWGTPGDEPPRHAEPLRHVQAGAEGGLGFRARFGVERDGDNLLAEGVYPVGSEIEDGYPEFTMQMLMDLGWDGDLTARARNRRGRRAKTNWKTDLSGGIQRVAIKHGCAPFGNAKARAVVWTFPDPVPIHREPLYTNRRDLVADYPTYEDRKFYRLPTRYASIQKTDFSEGLSRSSSPPAGWSSTRAAATRPAPTPGWPSCSRTCSSRSTRATPTTLASRRRAGLGRRPGRRQGQGHGHGHRPRRRPAWPSCRSTSAALPGRGPAVKYPEGADPYVLGEATNTARPMAMTR
jgi:formate dehydrogenase major subunit